MATAPPILSQKLQIALKECAESEYWLELLLESGYCSDREVLSGAAS